MKPEEAWHIITCEFPPKVGGVSAYVERLSADLARQGQRVHVWCPGRDHDEAMDDGVVLHRRMGNYSLADLWRLDKELSRHEAPRRVLLQWVPHGFGWRSMNVPLCGWLLKRSTCDGDIVEIMVHEPFLDFSGTAKQRVAAIVHRVMTMVLLRAARRIWVSTPVWQDRWKRYELSRGIPYTWLPIASSIASPGLDLRRVQECRRRYAPTRPLIGSFTGRASTRRDARVSALEPVLLRLLNGERSPEMLFIGENSEAVCREVALAYPVMASRLHATGSMSEAELSSSLQACDVLLQAYPDGITSRRTTAVTALAHGIPVVATADRSTESFWSETSAVVLVQNGDIDGMVTAVERLLADPEERSRLSAAARQLYSRVFNSERSIALLVGIDGCRVAGNPQSQII